MVPSRYVIVAATVALCSCLATCAVAQNTDAGSTLSRIPGGQTGAAILASSSDGMARYLAQDGPIQPALTAIGSLPVRATEQLNKGISRISSGLAHQAQSLSQSAGQSGQIRMPGLDAAASHMPESIASMGQSMQSMIRQKNQFIMGQAEKGIQAGNRLGQMMHNTMQARSSGPMMGSMGSMMEGPANMLSSAQDFMSKGASTIQEHVKEHLNGAMGRMGNMHGMGQSMMGQMQGIGRTVQEGFHGAFEQLQGTGQKVVSQLQSNHQKNMKSMGGVMGSFQGSMGKMGSNMQQSMDGVMQQAQNTAQQLHKMAHSALEAPMKVLSSLQDGLGSMMSGKGGSSSSSKGGRY